MPHYSIRLFTQLKRFPPYRRRAMYSPSPPPPSSPRERLWRNLSIPIAFASLTPWFVPWDLGAWWPLALILGFVLPISATAWASKLNASRPRAAYVLLGLSWLISTFAFTGFMKAISAEDGALGFAFEMSSFVAVIMILSLEGERAINRMHERFYSTWLAELSKKNGEGVRGRNEAHGKSPQ
jgi:hypothetical protein